MLKQTAIAFAAVAALGLGAVGSATTAEAGYKGKGGHHYHLYGGGKRFSYHYGPKCHWKSRPVRIKVWDDYSYGYIWKTTHRRYRVCY
jgi:hypothetical protein